VHCNARTREVDKSAVSGASVSRARRDRLLCHFQEFGPENMLLGEPLDGAEKRRSKGTGPSMLGTGSRSPTPRLPLSATFFRLAPSRRSQDSLPQHVSWPERVQRK
jgi:hypothetical protein